MIKLIYQKNNGEKLDITNLLESITWSGDYKSWARKLEFSLKSSPIDKNIPIVDIPLMSMILFYEDNNELFRGFVYEREKSSDNSISYLCYDYAAKLIANAIYHIFFTSLFSFFCICSHNHIINSNT